MEKAAFEVTKGLTPHFRTMYSLDMNKRTATHSGHCQACGSLQKLPAGFLSIHGYTVESGYFSGVCQGAKHLPYELSCDLIETLIAGAKRSLKDVKAFQTKLRAPATEAKAWIRTSQANPKGHYYAALRSWKLVAITLDESKGYPVFSYEGDTCWKQVRVEADAEKHITRAFYTYEVAPRTSELSTGRTTLLDLCTKYNTQYAEWLQSEVTSLTRYIAWQTERVTSWKLADLLPVTSKDKEGFKVTEAAY